MDGGCKTFGGCGLTEDTARLHDLVMHAAIGFAFWADAARAAGASEDPEGNRTLLEALNSTTTRTNFNEARLASIVERTIAARDSRREAFEAAGGVAPAVLPNSATWSAPDYSPEALDAADKGTAGIWPSFAKFGNDVAAAQELVVVGAKGAASYALQALEYGSTDTMRIDAPIQAALATVGEGRNDVGAHVDLAIGMGRAAATALELLDTASTATFGHSEPQSITAAERDGKAVLLSGDNLGELKALLEATAGTGVNVYTHGELQAAHALPAFSADKYPHLVGPFGAGWQLQEFDFARFPGPVVVSGTPLVQPRHRYRSRMFTTGESGLEEVPHLGSLGAPEARDALVAAAEAESGFVRDSLPFQTVAGYGRSAVEKLAAPLAAALRDGRVSQVVVIGGGDSGTAERSWFGALASALPEDAVVLTMGAVKNRLRVPGSTTVGGEAAMVPGTDLPRLVDMGSTAAAHTVLCLTQALSTALDRPVGDLPVSVALSWHEQRSVSVMLALAASGVRDMRVGPQPPRFVTPPVARMLDADYGVTFIPRLGEVAATAADVACGLGSAEPADMPIEAEVEFIMAKGHGQEAAMAAVERVAAMARLRIEEARAVAAQRRAHDSNSGGRRLATVV